MIILRDVSVSYGKFEAVKNITLEVETNQNLSIIGPNGCGKTTLLKAIASILPFKGNIEIDGKPIQKMKQKEISKKIALMSQFSGIYFSYSVFDTVMMGRYLHSKDGLFGIPSEIDREKVTQCLRALDLLNLKDKEITQLSGGQLQRVLLARTLVQEPEIILLDEPTNHLDLKYQIELIEYLRDWSIEGNHSVIGVLHDINLAMRLSDNVMIMKDGVCAANGNANETLTSQLLQDVYDVDVANFFSTSLKKWQSIA